MEEHATDIHSFVWVDHESVGLAITHVRSLELYRASVIRPSLTALSDAIEKLEQDGDQTALAFSDLPELFQSTVEGYLLTVQSMWERGLRAMLIERAQRSSKSDSYIQALKRAVWSGGKPLDLLRYFEELMFLPLQSFDTFGDLDLLQLLGSALRHGDGPAAQKLHERCPSLWVHWLPPGTHIEAAGFSYIHPVDAPKYPSFAQITIPEALLGQMVQSAIWFWDDVEHMRCNSFKRKHPNVVADLERWRSERQNRSAHRLWNPKSAR